MGVGVGEVVAAGDVLGTEEGSSGVGLAGQPEPELRRQHVEHSGSHAQTQRSRQEEWLEAFFTGFSFSALSV